MPVVELDVVNVTTVTTSWPTAYEGPSCAVITHRGHAYVRAMPSNHADEERVEMKGNVKTWMLMGLLYVLGATPIVVAFVWQVAAPNTGAVVVPPFVQTNTNTTTMTTNAFDEGPRALLAWSLWTALQVMGYVTLRTLGHGGWVDLRAKTSAEHKRDLLCLLCVSVSLTLIGRVSKRMDVVAWGTATGAPGLVFFVMLLVYAAVYTTMFELGRGMRITLTRQSVASCEWYKVLPLLTSLTLVLLMLSGLFETAWRVHGALFFWFYLGVALCVTLAHVVLITLDLSACSFSSSSTVYDDDDESNRSTKNNNNDDDSAVHLHHWYWPLPLAHAACFDTELAAVSQALFLAVHLHGVALFGCYPIFGKYGHSRRYRRHHRQHQGDYTEGKEHLTATNTTRRSVPPDDVYYAEMTDGRR